MNFNLAAFVVACLPAPPLPPLYNLYSRINSAPRYSALHCVTDHRTIIIISLVSSFLQLPLLRPRRRRSLSCNRPLCCRDERALNPRSQQPPRTICKFALLTAIIVRVIRGSGGNNKNSPFLIPDLSQCCRANPTRSG